MEPTPKDILDSLGGYRAVADALGQLHQTVHNWTRRGIPPKHWPAIVRMAAGNPEAAHITLDVLERTMPQEAA